MSKRRWMAVKRMIAWGLVFNMILPMLPVAADIYAPGKGVVQNVIPPAANALPKLQAVVQGDAVLEKPAENHLVVHQGEDKTILDWQSFNIGADAWTHFDQKGRTDWSVLNRIYDQNPSLIFGRLTADGKVFLINRNGMLFGPNARIQTHDLTASALNIDPGDFSKDQLHFKSEDYIGAGDENSLTSTVENRGDITVGHGGTVYLLGPNVTNSGTIDAPAGQVVMAAAEELTLDYESNTETYRTIQNVDVGSVPGVVANSDQGRLAADDGEVNLFGRVVNQDGLIRSVTAVSSSGIIRLKATERITTGKDSETRIDVSDSGEQLNRSAITKTNQISMEAPLVVHSGKIVAPSGEVRMVAGAGQTSADTAESPDEGSGSPEEPEIPPRIYLDEGSIIDVSGKEVNLSAQSRVADIQLNSIQLRDDQGQKEGELKGATISFDTRRGSAVGDVAEAIDNQMVTAGQNAVQGGQIYLTALEGEVIQRQGAALNFKGGKTTYAAGLVETTKVASGNKVYDISEAPQWLTYDRILGTWEKRYERFGIVEKYEGPYLDGGTILKGGLSSGYTEGADAGRLTVMARRVVLEGNMDGSAVAGPYQTLAQEFWDLSEKDVTLGRARPESGTLTIGKLAAKFSNENQSSDELRKDAVRELLTSEVLITAGSHSLFADGQAFKAGSDLLDSASVADGYQPDVYAPDASLISADLLNRSGLGTIEIRANDRIATEAGANLVLSVGANLSFNSRTIEHRGSLQIPAGTVTMVAGTTINSPLTVEYPADVPPPGVFLYSGSTISVAGALTDEALPVPGLEIPPAVPGQADGGTITLKDSNYVNTNVMQAGEGESKTARFGKGVILAPGALLDVSGGYTRTADGRITAGDAGTLELSGDTLALEGEFIGRALPTADGGKLTLHARNVTVQTEAPASALVAGGTLADIADDRVGKLIVSPSQLADTGFSDLTIASQEDLTVVAGVELSPSYAGSVEPDRVSTGNIMTGPTGLWDSDQPQIDGVILLSPDMVGKSAVTLSAGQWVPDEKDKNFKEDIQTVNLSQGATVVVAPGGTISLDAPAVEIAGGLTALGGTVAVTASNQDLYMAATGEINVSGTLIPGTQGILQSEAVASTPMDAGKVILQADQGGIYADQGARIDLSGSSAARYDILQADGAAGFEMAAGDPGSLELAFVTDLAVNAEVHTQRYLSDQPGAGLIIHRMALKDTDPGMTVDTLGLKQADESTGMITLGAALHSAQPYGFDTLTLKGDRSLEFGSDLELHLGRQLVLDAPTIAAAGNAPLVNMQAPWITVTNTMDVMVDDDALAQGSARLILDAAGKDFGRLDVKGSVGMSGFERVDLISAGDMVLADREYSRSGDGDNDLDNFAGRLATTGSINLTANQVYPATAAEFTVASPKQVVIGRNDSDSELNSVVYSAGGRLVISAPEILNYGRLLAPSGELVLSSGVVVDGEGTATYTPADRVYLAPGSLISTRGADFDVAYGSLSDAEVANSWQLVKGATTVQQTIDAAPEKLSVISAAEIVQEAGAQIDAAGSQGGVFTYGWLSGMEGSVNPLEGINVILPGAATSLPGKAVYLQGGPGIEEGVYTLLPAEYAFLPGAMVLAENGPSRKEYFSGRTIEGYRTVQGFATETGTGARSGRLTEYSLITGEQLLARGHFTQNAYAASQGGTISLEGDTMLLSGTMQGSGVDGALGGTLELAGRDIKLADNPRIFSAGYNPALSLADQYPDMAGTMTVGTGNLTDTGFDTVRIGKLVLDSKNYGTKDDPVYQYSPDSTSTIAISAGTQLKARNLVFEAVNAIEIEGGQGAGSLLGHTGETETLTLRCATGRTQLADGTLAQTRVLDENGDQVTPDGHVILGAGADLAAADTIIFDAPNLSLDGGVTVQNSTIKLMSDQITFLAGDSTEPALDNTPGLVITPDLWGKIAQNEMIELSSAGGVSFGSSADSQTDPFVVWDLGQGDLSIDTPALVNASGNGNASIAVKAGQIELFNSASPSETPRQGPGGSLSLIAEQHITVGRGDLRVDGFDDVVLSAAPGSDAYSSVIFQGNGSLTTDARLTVAADTVRTDLFRWNDADGHTRYEAAGFTVTAGELLAIAPVSDATLSPDTDYQGLPGTLNLIAERIEITGLIEMPSGALHVSDRQIEGAGEGTTGGIVIGNGARIQLAGGENFGGGSLNLTGTGSGSIVIASGAAIDLDAGHRDGEASFDDSLQGDAGNLAVTTSGGDVLLEGTLSARAADWGSGGAFALDAQSIDDIDGLLATVGAAGFSRSISVRSRTDSLTLGQSAAAPLALSASDISISADGGALTIGNVQLTAQTSAAGGSIALFANDDLNINADAVLRADAAPAGGAGGTIRAASGQGRVVQQGHLSVAGTAGASNGTVHFRALRNDDTGDAGMDLAGTITGAQSIAAEAVRVYDILPSADSETGLAVIDGNLVGTAIDHATAFLNKATAAGTTAPAKWNPTVAADDQGTLAQIALTPGIAFHSTADVAISGATIDLSNRRFNNDQVAGALTVRTKGNLSLDTALVDNPTADQAFFDDQTRTDTTGGWDFNLVAGADLQAVDRLTTDSTVGRESGKLTVNERLFTHTGDVGFASAGDTEIGPAGTVSMIPGGSRATYTLAGYRGGINGRVGGDLNLRQGIIQSAVGAIDLAVEKNINFTNADGGILNDVGGAIRTLGGPADGGDIQAVWDYQPGGTISVQAGQDINGGGLLGIIDGKTLTAWDRYTVSGVGQSKTIHYTADYSEGTQGIAAMAGGNVSVQAGGDIACQVGAFGQGDLAVQSGADIQGRYTILQGQGDLTAFGNIGQGVKKTTLELCGEPAADILEAGNVGLDVVAVGNVELDAVVNPTLFLRDSEGLQAQHLSYGRSSAVGIRALEGNIGLLGNYGYFDVYNESGPNTDLESILPPIMTLAAAGDITIAGKFKMSPSPLGHLSMYAAGSIIGSCESKGEMGGIDMVDLDLTDPDVPNLYDPEDFDKTLFSSSADRSSLLYADNRTPVTIAAGENIETIELILPKSALIVAGRDIVDLNYTGQHTDAADLSLIHAGGDIRLGVDATLNNFHTTLGAIEHRSRIIQGGTGTLLVQAGDSIDLGTSGGIQAVGNQNNKVLADQSCLLAVAAGYDLFESLAQNQALADPADFNDGILNDGARITAGLSVVFDQIRETGRIYSELLAEERDGAAAKLVADFRRNVLHTYFPLQETDDDAPRGDLNMINSRIKTTDKSEGIYIVTRGDINVGRSTLPDNDQVAKESGIFTEAGGGVNVYAAGRDRTLYPAGPTGNINVNESRIMTFLGGDITVWADQGDINAGRGSKGALLLPEEEVVADGGNRTRKYKPPVQGSGIRTLTYDPDGTQGPLGPARAGDGYIFAPEGEIDAGEAGIAVSNIYLAAVQYANVQNIEAGGVSVGVPMMVEAGADVDALAGSSNIADVVSASEEELASNARDRMDQMVQAINENLVKILNVEVVGFGADEKDTEGEDEEK